MIDLLSSEYDFSYIPDGNKFNSIYNKKCVLYIEEEHTTQWPKEKGQKDKKRSTEHTHKTKDRVTKSIPLTQTHDISLSWLSTGTLTNNGT